ncbi:MAG: GAF domain-containing protein [Chloroflexota bacterium]
MKFRHRLILLFLLIGLVPLFVVTIFALRSTQAAALNVQAARQEASATYLARDVQARVETLVQQLQSYVVNHSEQSFDDRFLLPKNTDLSLLMATRIGQNGYSFVYNLEATIMFHPDPEKVLQLLSQQSITQPDFWQIVSDSYATTGVVSGYYKEVRGGRSLQMYMATQRVPNTNLWVAVAVDTAEFLALDSRVIAEDRARVNFILTVYYILLVGFTVGVIAVTLAIANSLAKPIEWMAQTTESLMQYLETITRGLRMTTFKDEIKFLGYAIGLLSKQLRTQMGNLENLVKERTAELAQRTAQVETAAQVARESAEILDVDALLKQTTVLISERFGFYHVGIFLIDEAGEYAILRAANSDGGQRMLSKQHKLHLGQGVVGFVAAKGDPRIVLDTGSDAVHLKNPDLPFTRSELALAMRVRGRVIGVLDVQSTDPSAYREEDTRILQVLADQLALAIENARLYNQSQRTLRELETAYGHQAREGWLRRLEGKTLVYTYNRIGVKTTYLPGEDETEAIVMEPQVVLVDGFYELSMPLLLRNQALGTVVLRREAEQPSWSQEEIQVVRDSIAQIVSMLENVRLLEEIASRARQEGLISQVASKVQTSLDLETVLITAVREIGLAMSASRVEVDLDVAHHTERN